MKLCVDCNLNFRDRTYARCVECRRAYDRNLYHKNKERCKLACAKWYNSRPDYKDIVKNRRHSNPERMEKYRLSRKQDYWDNREKCLERARNYRQRNPAKILANTRRRWALIHNSEGKFTTEEWENLCRMFGDKCVNCGVSGKLEADHIIPLTLNGTNYITNIQPLCRLCNIRKRNIVIVDYRLKSKIENFDTMVNIYSI